MKRTGEATIAISIEPPYMELRPDGTPGGLGPELDRAILASMGVTRVRAEVMEFGAMIPALQAGRVSFVSSGGLYILPERCQSVLFAEPVACSRDTFIIPIRLVGKVSSYRDAAVQGLRVGVCAGCSQRKLAARAGVKDDKFVVWPNPVSAMKLLADQRVDVVVLDSTTATRLYQQLGEAPTHRLVAATDGPLYCGSAAFNKTDAALRDAYNRGLKAMIADGRYLALLKRHGLATLAVSANVEPTAVQCAKPNL